MNTPNRKTSTGRASIAVLLCVGFGSALAMSARANPSNADPTVTRSAHVSIAGLDLSTPEGARAAREQLNSTARRLCGQLADALDLSRHDNYVACVEETFATALRALDPKTRTADGKPDRHRPVATAKSDPIDPSTIRHARVSVADLDLSSPEGRRLAQERVRAVADRLCWQVTSGVQPGLFERVRACVDQALADATQQIIPPAQVAKGGDGSAPSQNP